MVFIRRLFLGCLLFLLSGEGEAYLPANTAQTTFICGVDVSFLQQIELAGGIYYDADGVEVDALTFFSEQGVNYVRLRLWNDPINGYHDLEYNLALAQRIHALDMRFLLDFHYSDTWADPAHQTKPRAWAELSFDELRTAVNRYTTEALQAFNEQGTPPDMVQIGNEISGGMLWDDGRVRGDENWSQLIDLLEAGARAVRETTPDAKIMLHIDSGGNRALSQWFFGHVVGEVDFDIIGLSYYSWWAGGLDKLQTNMAFLANRYEKPIIIVETAYPWTLDWSDNTHNLVGEAEQLEPEYPATPQGQHDFLQRLVDDIQQTPNELGMGFFYWEPVAISAPEFGSPWENLAQFDFEGRALPSMDVYGVCKG
jgi:arabinogalactan endo-1,4-beta-galactosidase